MSIAVVGGGAFGTALAISMAQSGAEVMLWARDVSALKSTRQSVHLPGAFLPNLVSISSKLEDVAKANEILLAIPMQSLSIVLTKISSPLEGKRLIACCKGVDLSTLAGPTKVIENIKPLSIPAILTGPSFAADIAKGLPTALTLACCDDAVGQSLQKQLSTPSFRLYRSTDVVGAELGGALKNVVAIACGACVGRGMGDSARAALMTRGFAEMVKLATHLGSKPDTMTGLSGMGDLALTCMSEQSRNFRFGLSIGRQEEFDASVTVEGVKTAEAVTRLAHQVGLDMPICKMVYNLSTKRVSVKTAIQALLSRPLKEE
ncbi:NAD(P)H-dependent glycerol-3-phosphate dehydrogenase [Pseudopelagicola sp. nBUS_19]|uniref:NAD(P)H-dependent glycerol-3-phosphate dehydrogenase n=1 Tax=Pseudopelagicola sp. nBUS_19 TaxID=3395316 RepID=UPI003EB8E015